MTAKPGVALYHGSSMRFAYIDSQGNEVTIPSVDALALRIELGAIGPDTDLYDAQADRWGPAQTHEIFHTLSRDVGGEGGFVAPPPPIAKPVEPEPEPEPAPAPEPEPVKEPEPTKETGLPKLGGGPGVADDESPPAPPVAEPDDMGFGFDLTFTDAGGVAPADEAAVEEDGAFDFGGFGPLELEGGLVDEGGPSPPPPPRQGDPDSLGEPFGVGMEMEEPLSDFSQDSAWMGPEGLIQDDGAMDIRRGSAQTGEEEAPPPRPPSRAERHEDPVDAPVQRKPRPEPRSRPSPPRRKKSFPIGTLLTGVVGLAVVSAGGYAAWNTFIRDGGRSSGPEVVVLPPVTIPDIPTELLPVMRDLGEAALVDMIDEMRAMQADFDLPAEPRNDWLAGVYLANVSQFPDVEEYWERLAAYVDRVRETDTRLFHEKYVAQLAAAEIDGDTAAILLERADSGFLATRDARFAAYGLMDDLVNAALDLHQFLLRNQDNIEYDPAAGGVSRDPVMEAVPNSPELGSEMWDLVNRTTEAMDALGSLERVSTERLTAVLFDRIRRAGFQ